MQNVEGTNTWVSETVPMQFGRMVDECGEPIDHTAVTIVVPDCLEHKNVRITIEVIE
jgi:hypothetical protein